MKTSLDLSLLTSLVVAGGALAQAACATSVAGTGGAGGEEAASTSASSAVASSASASSVQSSAIASSSSGAGGCAPGTMDCDGDAANGCEADVEGSISHCGDCFTVCSSFGGTPSCTQGKCSIVCDQSHADCDNDAATGCETDITSVADCGGCGNNCPGGPNATAACIKGKCALSCVGLTGDCNMLPGDGCEQDVSSDDNNCGSCGHACIGTSCVMGSCQAIVVESGLNSPLGIAVDNGYLYWVEAGSANANYTDGRVAREPIAGGPIEVLASGLAEPGGLVVDANNVYITVAGTQPVYSDGGVFSVPKAGGAPILLGSVPAAFWLVSDGTTLFVAGAGLQGGSGGSVASVPIAGGGATFLVPSAGGVYGVAVDATNVYYTDFFGNTASSLPKGGGAAKLLDMPAAPYNLAVDATSAYVSASTTLDVVPIGGGAVTNLVANGDSIANVMLDGGFVYYTDFNINIGFNDGVVNKIPVGGGAITPLTGGLMIPYGMATDATYLYVAEYGQGFADGSIRKVGK